MARDRIVSAVTDPDGTVRVFGREHQIELTGYDAFYVRAEHASRFPREWRDRVSDPERGFCRVQWPERARNSRWKRLEYFQENVFAPREIDVLEADVDPAQRFLIEHPSAQFAEDISLLYFDLETESVADWERPWESRILSFSWVSSRGRRGYVRLEAETDDAERKLLRAFAALADRHDILLAWNGDRFDFKVVAGRCVRLDVPFDPDLYHWIDHLRLFRRYFTRSQDGGVKQSFSLDAIAETFLGEERKVPVEGLARAKGYEKGDMFRWLWANAPDLLRVYNEQDSNLMELLEKKTGFVALHLGLCRLCRVLPGRSSLYATSLVDGRMLQQGWAAGYHFPTRFRSTDDGYHRARGAFVPEAVTGVHESVAVLDYARMYPSIILSFNMSLDTIASDGELTVPETTPKGALTGRTVARFRASPEGHLPAALRGIIGERKRYARMKDEATVQSPEWHDADRLSTACKVLANTFYGVVLSPFSRFHRHEIGESVTSFGRYLLATTIKTAESRGHKLVFGDTDSVAFTATDDEAEAVALEMNERTIPELLKRHGARPGEVRLEYEKRFEIVLVTASKRYAGRFAKYGGKPVAPGGQMDVRGLEIVRSDVCRAARALQRAVVEQILDRADGRKIWEALCELREDFVAGKTPIAELILQKAVTKRLEDYATKPIQVRVAERMVERGLEVGEGTKIQFLMVRGGRPIVPDELDQSPGLDLVAYWNKYVYPATKRAAEAAFPDLAWGDLDFQRGFDPNQLTLFEGGPPQLRGKSEKHGERPLRPVRPVATVPPRVRPIRRTVPRTVVLSVDEPAVDAPRLRALAEKFPGPHLLRIDVVVRDAGQVVELECPQRVASPAEPDFARALRALGIRGELRAGR